MKKDDFSIDALQPNDAGELYRFITDNTNHLQYYFPKTLSANSSLEKTIDYISVKQQEIQQKTNFTFAVREKHTQQIAGLAIIKNIDWLKNEAEFAYCIGSESQGKGLATHAAAQLCQYSFTELGLKKLRIIVHKTNLGSVKVAQNNGFQWQCTLPDEFTPTNQPPLDMELYELSR